MQKYASGKPRRPRHVALILDGNRRWADRRALPSHRDGHFEGMRRFFEAVRLCSDWEIPFVSVYAFSVENLVRDPIEIAALIDILRTALGQIVDPAGPLAGLDARVRFIGDRARVPLDVRDAMDSVESATAGAGGLTVFISVAYDGHDDVARSARRCIQDALAAGREGAELVEALTIEALSARMDLRAGGLDVPPVDLVVRTGGAHRLSGFLLWDIAHAEIVIDSELWPAFDAASFKAALDAYERRLPSSQASGLVYRAAAQDHRPSQ